MAGRNRGTREDFEALTESMHTGGPFNGYDFQGYVGHHQRNYITDAWALAGANALGWSLSELSGWMVTRDGRWSLEADAMDARHFQDMMATADIEAIMAGLLDEALEETQ
jgi:hypothetical protein